MWYFTFFDYMTLHIYDYMKNEGNSTNSKIKYLKSNYKKDKIIKKILNTYLKTSKKT